LYAPIIGQRRYGLSIRETAKKLRLIERLVEFSPDSLATFQEWKRLVAAHSITGIQVHDARIAAAMNAYGISQILTFNGNDFKRFSGITVVDPKSVIPQTIN
jgi:predicted nucleic acid-binding protein